MLEDIDIAHADGKARFVAEARPLLERVPPGPYRELLLDRLAAAIGVSAERFLTIIGPDSAARATARSRAGPPSRRQRPGRTARSAGRGGLVRQAVQNLLLFPASAAAAVAGRPGCAGWSGRTRRRHPAGDCSTACRHSPRPARHSCWNAGASTRLGERLAQLAASERIIPDEKAAGDELLTAVQKLAQASATAELDALLAKEQEPGLDGPERERLLELSARDPAEA